MNHPVFLREIGKAVSFTARMVVMRCDAAIVELNPYHFETIPAILEQLNRNGFHPLVLVHPLGIEAGFFDHLDRNLSFKLLPLPDDRAAMIRVIHWFLKKRLVVWNTLEPKPVLNWILTSFDNSLLRQSVGLIHNPGECLGWVGLSVYLHPSFHRTKDQFLPLFRFAGIDKPAEHGPIVLGVLGNLQLFRRNYKSLFLALADLPEDDRARFNVLIWGRECGGETMEVRALVAKYASKVKVEIVSRDFLTQAAFNQNLSQCDYILPLIDDTEDRYSKYFSNSMTGSILTSLAAGRALVLNRKLARLYGLENAAICYEHAFVGSALQELLRTGKPDNFRTELDDYHASQKTRANAVWAKILTAAQGKSTPSL